MTTKHAHINSSGYKLLYSYENNGNISSKTNVGDYLYDNAKKHAVVEVSELSKAYLNHDITYNHFGKTGTIQHLDRQYDGMDIAFVYGPTQERQQATLTTAWHTLHRYYAQNSEYTEIYADRLGVPQPDPAITLRKEYIYSPYGLIAIHNSYLTDVVYFNHEGVTPVATDHLGSIVAAYSPNRRTWEFSGYDAWGRRYRYDAGYDCREYPDRGWDFWGNPLDVYHIGSGSRGDYYDYYNPADMILVNSLSLRAQWNDYLGWLDYWSWY